MKAPVIGRSLPRLEDAPLVTGRGQFAADVAFAHMLHMRLARSTHAHGRIVAIDTQAARDFRGVEAVWTFADVADIPPIDFRLTRVEGLAPYRQTILARDRVRYVGEPVAAVFATDPYLAEDAADMVNVEVEELPAVLDAAAPPAGGFDQGHSTEAAVLEKSYGELAAAFQGAYAVVELDLSIGRQSGVPLETRGAIARHDRSRDVLELHGAAKVPHWNRDSIARMLGRDPATVHLYEGHVGGGFGVRGELYPEDVLVCLAALRLDRPVKWIEDRREHLIAANHSRAQRHKLRAAIDADGHVLAMDDEFFHDQGGYVRTHAATVPDLAAAMLPGPYRVPAYRAIGHLRLTNKTPGGTYRAPGRFESTFVRERMMDAAAARLAIDPVELRRRNLIAREEMPFTRPFSALGTHLVLDSGDYAGLLDKALHAVKWEELKRKLELRRSSGECVGAGLALFVEKSGLGPFETARVSVGTSGAVDVVTGAASVGQGIETVLAQVCADVLGVDYRRIRVVHGRTDRIAFGVGAFASRATVMAGEAARLAAVEVRAKALELAAELIQQPAVTLDIIDGTVGRSDMTAGPSITLGEIARALQPGSNPRGQGAGLSAEAAFYSDHMNYPYGVHIAVARVDRDTAGVTIERYFVAYDVGRAVNPMLVQGQLAGGMAQGIGGALLEEFRYDERGEPLSVNFADYLMPTAREVPELDVLITEDAPSPLNPLGVKGAGEGGINAVGAAVAAAIEDAIEIPGAIRELPVTPQRLHAILKKARPSR
jgi:carbon-monoxide dehydrogenase large subunit/6-hydroxypseudooxynicotine dehydrogenase subunit gamma